MKRKYTFLALVTTLIIVVLAFAGINDRFSSIQLEEDNYILMPEIATAPETPNSGWSKISARANFLYFKDDAGVEKKLIGSASNAIAIDGAALVNVFENSEVVTATNVITAAEAGKTFYLSSATEFVSTLPAASAVSAGTVFRFVIDLAPDGADYTVITGNTTENIMFGLAVVNGAMVDGASEDTITFTDGAAVKGDWAEVRSDGTSWYVSGQGVAATAITLTQAT